MQVVLNRAAEVEEQERQAAAAAEQAEADAEGEMQDAEQQTEEAAAEEAKEQQAAAAAPAWVPRVVVLGRLHKAVSTVQRAGEVVIVRPTHLAAQRAQPAPAPEVVVLPASARKTPAPSAIKRARTPAPSAAKGRTPAAVVAQARTPATGAAIAAKSATAAKSARKSIGGLSELPKSMVKEAPGEMPARTPACADAAGHSHGPCWERLGQVAATGWVCVASPPLCVCRPVWLAP